MDDLERQVRRHLRRGTVPERCERKSRQRHQYTLLQDHHKDTCTKCGRVAVLRERMASLPEETQRKVKQEIAEHKKAVRKEYEEYSRVVKKAKVYCAFSIGFDWYSTSSKCSSSSSSSSSRRRRRRRRRNRIRIVGCLTSQQHASVSQGRISSDNFTCCHTETEVAYQSFHLTQSQYTDTGPTSPTTDPITPGTWQGSHRSANF